MKVLIVRMWPEELNIYNYNCQEIGLAKSLIRSGHVCDIVLYTNGNPCEKDFIFDEDKKIHIYYLRAIKILKNAFFEKKLYQIVKDYDVIQTAEYDQIGNVKLKRKCKNKMVIYHGPYFSDYTKGYRKKTLVSDLYYLFHKKYMETPVISKSLLATKLLEKKGFKDITTVGVGLDVERFHGEVYNDNINQLIEKNKKENLKNILYVGKIEERRNIEFLLNIFSNVSKQKEDVRLIIVGKGDIDYIEKCKQIVLEKQIIDKIIYFESLKQEELQLLYKNSDIFLLPTNYEIFGMVLMEAMYFGNVVLTTLNGGSSMLLEHEKNGFICSLNDANQWENYIINVLNDSKYKKEISSNAVKTVTEHFTWNKVVLKFIDVYNKVKRG